MNITLIGMPGAGKSTVGIVLAKILNMNFTDTDLLIQQKYNSKLHELISLYGNEKYVRMEGEVILNTAFHNTVIATGGSAVYSTDAMEYLRSVSKIIYLYADAEEIKKRVGNLEKRGVVTFKKLSVDSIFEERIPLYEKYAHVTVNVSQTINKTIDDILKTL